jgi:hypothetical protein
MYISKLRHLNNHTNCVKKRLNNTCSLHWVTQLWVEMILFSLSTVEWCYGGCVSRCLFIPLLRLYHLHTQQLAHKQNRNSETQRQEMQRHCPRSVSSIPRSVPNLCFLVGLGFELRALYLQSRHSTAWVTPPAWESSFVKCSFMPSILYSKKGRRR